MDMAAKTDSGIPRALTASWIEEGSKPGGIVRREGLL